MKLCSDCKHESGDCKYYHSTCKSFEPKEIEKGCFNCANNINDTDCACQSLCGDNKEWKPKEKPKEKPMESKIIFNSVKSFCDFCFVIFGIMPKPEEIEAAQLSGHIRKSPVEEAEEMYKNFLHEYENPGVDTSWSNTVACIKTQHEAIQYLKAENERLKK